MMSLSGRAFDRQLEGHDYVLPYFMVSCPSQLIMKLQRIFSLIFAWVLAAVICSPQLIFWEEYAVQPEWKQCVTIWQVRAHEFSLHQNLTVMHTMFYPEEFAYNLAHLLFVFWIPVGCIAVSYLIITKWLWQKGYPSPSIGNSPQFSLEHPPSTGSWRPRRITKSTIVSYRQSNQAEEEMIEVDREHSGCTVGTGSTVGARVPGSTHREHSGCPGSRRESSKSNHTTVSEPRKSFEHALVVRKVRRNAIRVSVLLVLTYILTWLPYHVLSVWEAVDREHFQKHTRQMDFLHGLVVFNSVINPFLYGMFGRFKRYTRSG